VLRGFKDFIMRGNVVELAVGVVIGAAFNGLVTQFTESFLKPLIQLISGGHDVSGKAHVPNTSVYFDWGAFINAAIAFLLTAAALYFLIIMPMNKLAERRARGQEPESKAPAEDIRLLTEIRDALIAQQGLVPAQSARPLGTPAGEMTDSTRATVLTSGGDHRCGHEPGGGTAPPAQPLHAHDGRAGRLSDPRRGADLVTCSVARVVGAVVPDRYGAAALVRGRAGQ
jgi:large conductance mechanosensitive channel